MPSQTSRELPQAARKRTASPATSVVLQLKVELMKVRPKVWRRIVVNDSIKLSALSTVILSAMGWDLSHMHEFAFGKTTYGIDYPDDLELEPGHEDRITLAQARGQLSSFTLRYDFGDGWEHRIKVEKVLDQTPLAHAICLGAENACPPEDVGGPAGYAHFVQVIGNPKHPDYMELYAKHGRNFDPALVSVDTINAQLKEIRI